MAAGGGVSGIQVRSGFAERWALAQRVAHSRPFERAARLREFLLYVCEEALKNPGGELHEQQIGARVFGREPQYETNLDNIVRVNATQLRKKLEAYFAAEGLQEPLIIEIPKGQYLPVFRPRDTVEPREPVLEVPVSRRPTKIVMILVAACAVLAIAVAVLLAERYFRPPSKASELRSHPALAAFWSPFLRQGQTTDLVIADSAVSLVQDLIGRPLTLAEYLDRELWHRAEMLNAQPDLQTATRAAAEKQYTSLADAHILASLSTIMARESVQPQMIFARDFNVRHLKTDNVILLGSKRANPWVELFEKRMNFQFRFEFASRQSFFQNQAPQPGEQARYQNDRKGSSYCVIAVLPNLSGSGRVLIIQGTEMEGTEAGGEFVTNGATLANLERRLGTSGSFPYFEALLNVRKLAGAARGSQVIAHRIIQP